MGATLVLLLPSLGDDAPQSIRSWWLIDDGAVVQRGDDAGWQAHGDAEIIALAPADDVPVQFHNLPGLTAPQAQAAARLQASEWLLGDAAMNHLAVGTLQADNVVASAWVANAAMDHWLALCDDLGIVLRAMVPVAALPPTPQPGSAVSAVIGPLALLRTEQICAASDPALDALRLSGMTTAAADPSVVEGWIVRLASAIPINLLSGRYARREGASLDPVQRRWLVRLVAALVVISLAVPVVQMWQRSQTIKAADARAIAAATRVGVTADNAAEAEAALDRQLAMRGGGPLALSAPLSGLYQGLQAHPSVAVRNLSHLANGTLSVTLASPRMEDVNAVLADLQARAFVVTGQPLSGTDGMQMAAITVRALP